MLSNSFMVGLFLFFPQYGKPLSKNFDHTSTANQNIIPNSSGFYCIYYVKGRGALLENNYSSIVIFSPAL